MRVVDTRRVAPSQREPVPRDRHGGDGEEARAVLEAGADQVLRKPISVSSAARVLAAVARGAPAVIEALAVA